jgi:hypothetical protein
MAIRFTPNLIVLKHSVRSLAVKGQSCAGLVHILNWNFYGTKGATQDVKSVRANLKRLSEGPCLEILET